MSSHVGRNSNVESLRLFAIILILLNHTVQEKILDLSIASPFLSYGSYFLARLGGLGDVIFFGITAWYLAAGATTPKKSCERAWLLERQLLFYSVGLFLFVLLMRGAGLGFKSVEVKGIISWGISSAFPLLTKVWWYPTSYVCFLLVCPWANRILRRLGGGDFTGIWQSWQSCSSRFCRAVA